MKKKKYIITIQIEVPDDDDEGEGIVDGLIEEARVYLEDRNGRWIDATTNP